MAAVLLIGALSACAWSPRVALEMPRDGACRVHPDSIAGFPLCVHDDLIQRSLSDVFSPDALEIVIDACRSMDHNPVAAFDPLNHFDNGQIEGSVRRMEERYRRIRETSDPVEALKLFGRIIHAAQDFMAHSNYVEVMVEIQRGAGVAVSAPPPFSIVASFEESEASLMADSFEVPKSFEPMLRQAMASGRITSGHVCLLDYPFDLLGKIPVLGDVTNLARHIVSVPGTILGIIPGIGDVTSYVIPVFKSHYNMSKDHDDYPSAQVRLEDGRTVYDLCLETAAAQTRYEFDRHFSKAVRVNRTLRRIDWKQWQNPNKAKVKR